MNSRYFYLQLEAELSGAVRADLAAKQLLSEAGKQLFGECGAPEVDILRVDSSGIILLRVHAKQHRRLRAALTLCPKTVRVLSEAPTLQALI